MIRRKIMVVISSLQAGGTERVASLLASSWYSEGHEVIFVTWLSESTDHYKLPSGIKRITCLGPGEGALASWLNRRMRVLRLRSVIKSNKADVIISFVDRTNVVAVVAAAGTCTPVVISERVDPGVYNPGFGWKFLRNAFYGLAERVVVQTESIAEKVRKLSLFSAKITVIPNPVSEEFFQNTPGRELIVFSAGRLTAQKGFDTLIRAFASVYDRMDQYKLVIAGEGPEKKNLESLATSLGCSSRIVFTGVLEDIGQWYRKASVFVLSSRYEGFPNVLIEAMASGCAVIASDCPGGPRDIVTDGQDGLMVPVDNVPALSGAIMKLACDEGLREKLGAKASEKARQYSVEKVITRWNSLISGL